MSDLPTNPEDLKAIREAFDQISGELDTIDGSKTQINEILKALEDKYQISKSTFRKVSTMYHKRSMAEFETETSEIKDLYQAITK